MSYYYATYTTDPLLTTQESQPGSPYKASIPQASRQLTKRQRGLFYAALLGTFISWAFGQLHSILPPPSPSQPRAPPSARVDMTSFWHDFRYLLTATEDYDDWFADADAATRAIGTMWARVLRRDEEWHAHYDGVIAARARRLRLAHGEWRGFLESRERAIVELVGCSAALWRVYVDGRPVEDAEGGRWAAVLRMDPGLLDLGLEALDYMVEEGGRGNGTAFLQEEEKEVLAALRFVARRITEELVRAHAELFKDLDAAYEHMREAESADKELKGLINQMTKGRSGRGIWTSQMGISVGRLKRRMQKLLEKQETMAIGVEWLQMQFPEDIESAPEKIADRAAWLESAKGLLREWAAALLDVQEGVLFLLRRRELPREKRLTVNYVPTWEAWKRRNCGGTSCYDAPGAMANVKSIVHLGKPIANVAQDEADWIRSLGGNGRPRVWRGVYDKACCQTSVFGDRILHGSDQPSARSH
ncbi:hypothetical protein F4859DRAFT_516244 [Xylaria cf. heliscus]|nr:hypothetical protein F4859DRAFT_516244 [Xylaria cf. heliscus]